MTKVTKKMIKAGLLELHQEGKNKERSKNIGKYNFPSLLKFSMFDFRSKNITLSDMVLKVGRGNIQDNYKQSSV